MLINFLLLGILYLSLYIIKNNKNNNMQAYKEITTEKNVTRVEIQKQTLNNGIQTEMFRTARTGMWAKAAVHTNKAKYGKNNRRQNKVKI